MRGEFSVWEVWVDCARWELPVQFQARLLRTPFRLAEGYREVPGQGHQREEDQALGRVVAGASVGHLSPPILPYTHAVPNSPSAAPRPDPATAARCRVEARPPSRRGPVSAA